MAPPPGKDLNGLSALMILDNPCRPDWRVMKEAAALTESGVRVTILAWNRKGDAPPREVIDGIRIVRVEPALISSSKVSQAIRLVRFWLAAIRVGVRGHYDVIHCHDLPTLPAGVVIAAAKRVPLIYDAHELYWLMVRHRGRALAAGLRLLERVLLRRVDAVITVSSLVSAELPPSRSRVAIVPNWYEPKGVRDAGGADLRRDLGIDPAALCVAHVGFFSHERLTSLLADYGIQHPETVVLFAGSGGNEPELRRRAAHCPNVHFLGWQNDPGAVYSAADILFHGTRSSSPYGRILSPNTLFLSIAYAIPLISTATGECGPLIRNTGAGVILEQPTVGALSDCVDRLRDPAARDEIRDRLIALQETYRWSRAADELRAVYRRVAGCGDI